MTEVPLRGDVARSTLDMAVAGNLHALFRAMCGLPGAEFEAMKGLCRHHSFPSNPMFKGVWQCRLSGAELDHAIDEAVAWFTHRKAPYFFWWTDPGTPLAGLAKALEARGLIDVEGQARDLAPGIVQSAQGSPCMALRLAEMDSDRLAAADRELVIQPVRDEEGLHDFARVFVDTYRIPAWAAQGWIDATLAFGITRAPWQFHVGRVQGKPVATTILFCGAGVASVYGVAVLPQAQGRGYGAAITGVPLLQAMAQGYEYAVLFSSEQGLRTYGSLGFRRTGGHINRYLWRA